MRNENAKQIGNTIVMARLRRGYSERSSFVDTKKMRNKLSAEGLRKIEDGIRVPRIETLDLLCDALEISNKTKADLRRLVVKTTVERAVREIGNIPIIFRIDGEPMTVLQLPPTRKVEKFVREVIEELTKVTVARYGVMDQDIQHFQRHARGVLLKKLART